MLLAEEDQDLEFESAILIQSDPIRDVALIVESSKIRLLFDTFQQCSFEFDWILSQKDIRWEKFFGSILKNCFSGMNTSIITHHYEQGKISSFL